MTILKSIIRTFFLGLSIETFFERVQRTFMVIHSTGEQIHPSEITAGMWLSRISDKERDIFGCKLSYFGCVVRDINLIDNVIHINFQSAVGYDEDEQPEDIDVGAIDYQYLTIDECDFFR